MTPSEMEQEIKNLNVRTSAIEQILPTLATKQDLLLTREELKAGLEDAKRYALMLNEATRDDIRLLAEQMATKGDLQELRHEMRLMGDDVRSIAEQVAILSARKRKK